MTTENIKSIQDLFNHMKSELYGGTFVHNGKHYDSNPSVLNQSEVSINVMAKYLDSSHIETTYHATGTEVNIYATNFRGDKTLMGSVPCGIKNLSRLAALAHKQTQARFEEEFYDNMDEAQRQAEVAEKVEFSY